MSANPVFTRRVPFPAVARPLRAHPVLFILIGALLAGGLAATSLVFLSSSAPGTGLPAGDTQLPATASPAITPTGVAGTSADCTVLADICAFALKVERQLRARDYTAVAATGPTLEPALRDMAARGLGDGAPRLVSIGCPFGAVSPACEPSFSLVFTTLDPAADWTGHGGILLLRYDRKPGGPVLTGVNTLEERDLRRVALAGGLGFQICNLSGVAPGEVMYLNGESCSRSEFYPYWSERPFVPIEVRAEDPFQVAAPAAIPANTVLYVATGCWGCEGHDSGLVRASADRVGAIAIERLTIGGLREDEVATTYAATPDGSMLVAATCSGTVCTPLGTGSTDARSRLLASTDGGFTWREIGAYQGYAWPEVGADGRIIVSRSSGAGDPSTWTESWEMIPASGPLVRPAGTEAQSGPILIPGGVAWLNASRDGLIRSDGSAYIRFPLTASDQLSATQVLADGRVLVTWSHQAPPLSGPTKFFAGLYRTDGTEAWRHELTAESQLSMGLPVSGESALANIQDPRPGTYGQLPALADFAAGIIRPFGAPFGEMPIAGRNRLLALRSGLFARVAGAGDCLNVRAEPSTAAGVIGCFRDGVLLTDLEETRDAGGLTWVHVGTPSGDQGWASAQYLVR